MSEKELLELLASVKSCSMNVDEALQKLKELPYSRSLNMPRSIPTEKYAQVTPKSFSAPVKP